MSKLPYNKAIRPGDIKVFKIYGRNGTSVDLSTAIGEFYYYESILSNTVTATVAFIDSGFEVAGKKRTRTSGIVDDLELVGGEEVEFEVIDNKDTGGGEITSEIGDSDKMYIKSITNVATTVSKKVFILELVSKEYWVNESVRV